MTLTIAMIMRQRLIAIMNGIAHLLIYHESMKAESHLEIEQIRRKGYGVRKCLRLIDCTKH